MPLSAAVPSLNGCTEFVGDDQVVKHLPVEGMDTERGRGAAINDALNRASNRVISS